ncbi:MAG: ribonuclease Y, partial [Firmicutes bacterium CAG:272_52_7]
MKEILMIGIPAIIGLVIGALAGFFVRKKISEAKIGSAEDQAKKIVEEGEKTAETLKKEALIEAKEKILRDKAESEKEIKERRNEVTRLERRAVAREETLEKKIESYERKEETLNRKIKEQSELVEKTEQLRLEQAAKLEAVAGLSRDEAKAELVSLIETEAKHEAAMRIVEIESQLKEDADKKARSIISLAIQRCASEHVSEATVSVVALPNDDMKGRIIGREGRNIRTIETMTGVDLIIDDTPEAITVSCFDPVRREVARLALEKLISDGRIHPTRIEETVEKARREVDNVIKQSGERATFETGVHGLNPELVKLLGRLRYRTSYGQNVLDHSIEVAHIAGIIADEIGADSTLAKRAGLLHDIGKAMTQEVEGSHVQIGIDIARKYKENRDVIHAIEAHHNDVEPQTVVAMIIQAADAISAARPGARREDLENYL